MKQYLTGAIFFLASLAALAQDSLAPTTQVQYRFRIDSTSLLLGDQAELTIEPSAVFPTLEDLSNNGIEAARQRVDTTDGTLHTTLTSFEVGEHWYHIGADSLLITVRDVPGVDTASTDIKDIAGILNQPYTFGEVAKVVGIVLGILALIAVAVLVYLRLKKHKPLISIPQKPPLPPHTKALEALERLRQQQLWQHGQVKEYHTTLTHILRTYLEETYHIPSIEMTTDQTLEAFRGTSAFDQDSYHKLSQILQTADMVKFAKSQPLPYQHDLSMTQTIDFVVSTAPKPVSDTTSSTSSVDPPKNNPQQ